MHDPQSITVNDDERMIPVWSIIAASLAFVLVEYYFWVVAPRSTITLRRRSVCVFTSIFRGAWSRRSIS
jgi:hypothetical protein